MFRAFKALDELLRGQRTGEMTAEGAGGPAIPLRVFLPLAVGLGATYGFFMGWFRVSMRWGTGVSDGYEQMLASMVKLPALFLLTLGVTFPSLYVFSALLGGRLNFGALLRLLTGTMVVSLAVAASFGPILAFFTLSTTSHSFMVVLNVILLGVSGFVGVGFLMKALRRIAGPDPAPGDVLGAKDNGSGVIFGVWTIIYGAVGVQMAWLLRPFIGHPGADFGWFRPRSGNFISGLFDHFGHLAGN